MVVGDFRVFVTGTDTGVGKTFVSTILALGMTARYWKPIQAGRAPYTDSDFVRRYIDPKHILKEAYLLNDPVSPHIAARRERVEIQLEVLMKTLPSGPLIVEGAGGVMVPINSSQFMIDLIQALELPVIVVTRTALGTINHSLLTLEALSRRNCRVMGIIFNGPHNAETIDTIVERSGYRSLGCLPRLVHPQKEDLVSTFSKLSFGS